MKNRLVLWPLRTGSDELRRLAIVNTDGKLWFLPRPKGVPKDRGGHGMPLRLLIDELTHAVSSWCRARRSSAGACLAIFRKPG